MNDAPAAEPLIESVSLAQYAAVEAGCGAGVPIEIVLENEGVAPDRWPDAEEGWTAQLLDEEDDDEPLLIAYEERLAEAQARYGRPVRPLDEDLGAWLDFMRHWAAAADPNAMLGEVGMRPSDMALLHRAWSAKIARDPAVAARAKEILSAPPGALPEIAVEAVRPKPPSPDRVWSTTVPPLALLDDEDDDEDDDIDEDDDDDDESEVPLFAPLPQWIESAARAPKPAAPKAPPPAKAPPPPAAVAPPPMAPPPMAPPPMAPPLAPAQPAPRALVLPDLPEDATAPPQISPLANTPLPFKPAKSVTVTEVARAVTPTKPPARPAAKPLRMPDPDSDSDDPLETTLEGAVSPFASVMPFAANSPPAAAPKPAPKPATAELQGTVAGVVMSPFASALPFADKGPSDKAAPRPQAPPGAATLTSLPFVPASPPAAEATKAASPNAVTTGGSGAAGAPAKGGPPAGAPQRPSPTRPGSGTVALTLSQYASLCAELSVKPHAQEEVFNRYGLGALRDRLAVDLAWRERLRQNAAEYQEWQSLYERYHRYLSASPKGGGSDRGGGA